LLYIFKAKEEMREGGKQGRRREKWRMRKNWKKKVENEERWREK
jgi:hypothetical protein